MYLDFYFSVEEFLVAGLFICIGAFTSMGVNALMGSRKVYWLRAGAYGGWSVFVAFLHGIVSFPIFGTWDPGVEVLINLISMIAISMAIPLVTGSTIVQSLLLTVPAFLVSYVVGIAWVMIGYSMYS